MSAPSLQAKKAYFAKVRRRNYAASLRLEGFEAAGSTVKHKSRKAAVLAHVRADNPKGW
jgi:hypothetical protein